MQLVKEGIGPETGLRCFTFYEYKDCKWQLKHTELLRGQAQLYELLCKQDEAVDYAVLNLNVAYRNTFYACYPSVLIAIDPQAVWRFLEKVWWGHSEAYMEFAISLEAANPEEDCYENGYDFLKQFYNMPNKEAAYAYYEDWQLQVDLTNHYLQKFIRIMECFKDEILNYFILKTVINI